MKPPQFPGPFPGPYPPALGPEPGPPAKTYETPNATITINPAATILFFIYLLLLFCLRYFLLLQGVCHLFSKIGFIRTFSRKLNSNSRIIL
jgi:hypothetical protein